MVPSDSSKPVLLSRTFAGNNNAAMKKEWGTLRMTRASSQATEEDCDEDLSHRTEASTLPDLVDVLERGLAKCLADYRAEAEELLSQHLEMLEDMQGASNLQVANLRAENNVLRERLGLPLTNQAQQVLFQCAEPPKKKGKVTARTKFHGDDEKPTLQRGTSRSDDADGKLLNVRKRADRQQPPAGSWQSFVAWVPNGASLQNPEPWRPLPQQEPTQSSLQQLRRGTTVGLGRKQSDANTHQMSGVLPGALAMPATFAAPAVPGILEEQAAGKSEDSDDSQSEKSSMAGQEQFQMLEVWQASTRQKRKLKSGINNYDSDSSRPFCEEEVELHQNHPPYVLNPDSHVRVSWDLLSLFMVVYDMVMIPMEAFEMPKNMFLVFMEWTTRLFWTLDMGWSCCTGIVQTDGNVEYDMRVIIRRYAKSWLALDLVIVCSDWAEVIFSSGSMAMISFARSTRIIRVVRLLRLVRMQEIISSVTERIQSDNLGQLAHLTKLLTLVLFLSHFTACTWWMLGDRTTAEPTWVKQNLYKDSPLESQYMVSLHWALSQFSGGMEEITPASVPERLYAVAIGTLSYMVALVMVGTFTSSLTQQYIIGGSGARQMATLKTYLKQNSLSKIITKRVLRNAKHAISGDLTPDSVELLHVISEPLKVEMHYEIYSQILTCHPFFLELLTERSPVIRPICHRAMSMLLLSNSDIVFSLGEEPPEPKMYFASAGTLEYTDAYGEVTTVSDRSFFSEAALWTTWRHRGTLMAVTDVKIAMLDAQNFQDICRRYMRRHEAGLRMMCYAQAFVEELNKNEHQTDIAI
eukprot:TRINITY_DN15543_c0_g1_i1.p1 TRINITY_DN15543_c0_g1~~TRINITY_DN15543_c0_g1_i1.p1  ORF type:complete len:805 (-),score=156.66 TRINITY_DN15543_c0_g1_i1:74-2488(-)